MQNSSPHAPGGAGAPVAVSDAALAAPAAAPGASSSSAAAADDASAAAAAAAAAGAPPPAKGLLLRVKRKRHEAPLDTLVVTSTRAERAEKRAAVEDLRGAFHRGAQLSHSGTEQLTGRAADAAAVSCATFKSAESTGATVPAVPAAAAAASTSAPLFRSRPQGQRVFKLLTTISGPKEQHASNDKIQQRIEQLRHNRLLSLPHLLPTAADVHAKHLAASEISAREKRELLLQQNRARMAALQQRSANPAAVLPKQQEMLHLSEDLLVKIVDINLPGSVAAARTTFEPAPLQQQTAQQRKEQKRREAELELSGSSHRGVAGSSLVRGAAPAGSAAAAAAFTPRMTPQEGAREFSRAMASIKQMPQMGRAQMDAYKGLLEDWLSTQPFDPALAQPSAVSRAKTPPPEPARDTVVLPGLDLGTKPPPAQREDPDAAPRSQSPHLYSRAPNVNIKRRKAKAAAPPTDDTVAASTATAAAAPAPSAATAAALPTVGGVSYDPSKLVQTTGTSLHGAKGVAQLQQRQQADSMQTEEDVATPTGSEDSGEYVYDVYHLPDDEAAPSAAAAPSDAPNPAAVGGAGPQHRHGSSTAVPIGSIVPDAASGGDEYKASYDGASSAYVVLHDGVLEWMNPSGLDDLVQEDALAAEDEGDVDDEDPDGQEIDYSDEDSSAEEEHADRYMHSRAFDDPDDVPFAGAGRATQRDGPLTMLNPQQFHSLRQLQHAAQRPHGFYPDGPHDDEAEDDEVQDVRRAMRAGRAELSSSDGGSSDEDGSGVRRMRPAREQDDEDYADTIEAEEDMDDEREMDSE